MAYVPSELRLLVTAMASSGGGASGTPQIWSLQGVDAVGDVDAADFITDGLARGMRKGDLVFYTRWDNITTKATVVGHHIFSVMTVDADGADLSTGTAVTATNSD
jgi:hypothetical protein